ncbi:hypothetical protein [Algoriphagus hitonicola]|nr:hypothetical protein [Algoriphagus hitonicola]
MKKILCIIFMVIAFAPYTFSEEDTKIITSCPDGDEKTCMTLKTNGVVYGVVYIGDGPNSVIIAD